jgi:signal transduction histidine kinase
VDSVKGPMWSRGTVWSSALVVGIVQVAGSFGAAEEQLDRRALDAAAIVLLLIGPFALAVRDRWPLAAVVTTVSAATVYIGVGYPYGPIFVSIAVAFYALAQAGHRRTSWVSAPLAYLAIVAAATVDPFAERGHTVVKLALIAGWLAMVVAVSELVRVRREQAAEREQAARDERQRRLSEQRLQLAQELHDVLAHNISLINVQASVALHLLDEQPGQARPALTNIKEASRDALAQLRTALDVLRLGEGAPRAPAPGLADLDALASGVRASGLSVVIERDDHLPPLPAEVELAAYRIVQEALTNVTRHADARLVTVRIANHDGLNIEVLDDGIGGRAGPGNGITGMRERARALGGSVQAGPHPRGGFRVSARIPVTTS